MKPYLLFAGENFYPEGGESDFIGSFDSLDECESVYKEGTLYEWASILEINTGKWYSDSKNSKTRNWKN